jgi:pimeloyl-ACP methyl ester carboxylesterase
MALKEQKVLAALDFMVAEDKKAQRKVSSSTATTSTTSTATATTTTNAPATLHSVKFSTPNTDPNATPLVLFHGYGSGTGIFYAVLPGLTEMWKGNVYVVDLLGCGLSTRKPWTLGFGSDADLNKTEEYFCDAIEEWRKNIGIEKMVLAGHSMGGYITTVYCEKYSSSIEKLLLLSPVGIPDPDKNIKERLKNAPWYFRMSFSMWESGYSPMALPGTWHLLGMHGNARFNNASWTTKELLRNYFYYNWCNGDPSAGARTHSTLLAPGAYARSPLRTRIPKLRGKIPRISCIYGETDWMDYRHFEKVKKAIVDERTERETKSSSSSSSSSNNNNDDDLGPFPIDITRVAGAGHNLMVDNPEGFLDAFWYIMNEWNDDSLNQTNGMNDGNVYGQHAWMRENGTFNDMKEGLILEGRSMNKHGTKANPYIWTKCQVMKDHGNGKYKVKWLEGKSEGKVSTHFPGHKFRKIGSTN